MKPFGLRQFQKNFFNGKYFTDRSLNSERLREEYMEVALMLIFKERQNRFRIKELTLEMKS